ncbi:ATP F0F1 synthase synthase [Vibrio campbellii]|uniref:ATP F0F1 synthase synthase n=1 Tax=Vibrio campbellii TaxID=680 RepID=UPI000A2F9CF0|nr:ATP F0F1 synthase synthase [Vibrio campbellii]ARR45963.1 ATP F0F1 synthase synthase [Vibrio campbellii]ARR47765.1 ATP F0F1 synthase synthase [Vibrio campbellii]
MDLVLAKVKGRSKKSIFKLLSDETLFDELVVTDDACVGYAPDHNLDEDSWFKIDNFSQQPYCLEILKTDFDSKDYDDLPKAKFKEIAQLYAVQGDNFYFQKITPSLFVTKKMIAFGEVAELESTEKRLVVNQVADAVYYKAQDKLVFKNLATISSIFKGIDELYKEATKEEVEKFLEEDFIELADGYDTSKVSKPNRKRIALAMDTLAALPMEERDQMYSYIHSYCEQKLTFDKENSTFEINSDDELKYLLYGIEQRFYTTPLGHEKRLANSVQPM